MALDIAEVAQLSGVPASTLRYYEEKGLVRSVGRRGLRRVFADDVLERLALIALGRSVGFSLDEIGRVFASGGRPKIDRTMLAAKADELDLAIRGLSAMRDGLQHAAVCRAPNHMECPTFRRLLRSAASGAIERATKSIRLASVAPRAKKGQQGGRRPAKS
jgi:DNA-binding transcriptional MerR regulator